MTGRAGASIFDRTTLRRALVVLCLPAESFLLFGSAGRDDTHITFWSAHALSSYGAIVNVNGERIEQSSSLLFTLLLAGLERLTGLAVPTLGFAASLIFGMLAVVLTGRVARELGRRLEEPAMLLAALCPPLVYWSLGGMETTLHACLLLGVVLLTIRLEEAVGDRRKPMLWLAGVTVLFLANRPEAMFTGALSLCAAGAAIGILRRRASIRTEKTLGSILFLVVCLAAALMVARWFYFGAIFPQPVVAKARPIDAETVSQGILYVYEQAGAFGIAVLLVLSALGIAARSWEVAEDRGASLAPMCFRYVLIAAFLAVHLSFAVAVGGDWMEYARFLVAPLPLVVVLAVDYVCGARSHPAPFYALAAVSGASLVLSAIAMGAAGTSTGLPYWNRAAVTAPEGVSWFEASNRIHADDLEVISQISNVLEEAIAKNHRPIVVYSGQAGMVVYYLAKRFYRQMIFVDTRGLATSQVTRCPEAAGLKRNVFGVVFDYATYFDHRAAWDSCEMPEPDIVFDLLRPPAAKALTAAGYARTFATAGSLVRPPESLFVRRGLLEEGTRR